MEVGQVLSLPDTAENLVASGRGILAADESIATMSRRLGRAGVPLPVAAHTLGIQPGIEVDTGTVALPFTGAGVITEGLDGLAAAATGDRDRSASPRQHQGTQLALASQLVGQTLEVGVDESTVEERAGRIGWIGHVDVAQLARPRVDLAEQLTMTHLQEG